MKDMKISLYTRCEVFPDEGIKSLKCETWTHYQDLTV